MKSLFRMMVWPTASRLPGKFQTEVGPNPSFLYLALGCQEVKGGEGSSKGKKSKRERN
jgi:hypothetical protein